MSFGAFYWQRRKGLMFLVWAPDWTFRMQTFGRLASFVGITEIETGVGKLGYSMGFWQKK